LASTLADSGVVGRDLLAVDWAGNPLGPMARWSPGLQTAVRIVVTSRFSMWMAWGPELVFFCNDAYRRDTLGVKYPWALGQSARDVWAEIWPDIGPRIDTVLATGQATWDEALLLFLERSGYVEETYHTFSYSPLPDEGGRVAGMLCVVSEETDRVIDARRIGTLRDLGMETATAPREPDIWDHAARALGANPRSLPFTATYLFDDRGHRARLACATGFPAAHPAAPQQLDSDHPVWPWQQLLEGRPVLIEDLDRFPDLPTGDWRQPPQQAMALPLPAPGQPHPYGFMVVGLNRYRPFDDAYRGFVGLVAGQLAARLGAARSYEAERARAESLAELDRAKTAFFTNVSHEFRTPLTLLLAPAEDALSDREFPLPEAQRSRLEMVVRNGQRLLKLVNTLLDFSRLQSGESTGRFEPVDLDILTSELVAMFESAVHRAGLSLTVEVSPPAEPVYVDRDMWAKIVFNLLSNALKFTFAGGITVRLTPAAGAMTLTVADTGIGIAPEDQERLFERFHRVQGARARSHEGSGIGLALVAELAELHGGTVAVTSAPGAGSTFSVTLPYGRAHLPPELVADTPAANDGHLAESQAADFVAEAMRWLGESAPTPAAGAAPTDTGRALVLVVDDNADMRQYVSRLLAGEYLVETAADGAAALARARQRPPDLVITDVMMPRLDGFGLLNALRSDPVTVNVPVIMVSARAGDEGVVEGLDAGADDYLFKPFSARELQARVRSSLELDRSRRTRQALEEGRRLLDQAQRLAHLGSWEVDLATGTVVASDELLRMFRRTPAQLAGADVEQFLAELVHPGDRDRVRRILEDAARAGGSYDYDMRIIHADGTEILARVRGEAVVDDENRVTALRGSVQDVTQERKAERALATAAAAQEVAAREQQIADELQASLLPPHTFDPDHLDVDTYYRAGVAGIHVGGDWYDVIELSAGRTALVIGDVMGRGVRAASVMGQVRSAVRAYARLDLPPAEALEYLDGVVSDLSGDHIVTCVYAIYDPHDRSLTYANAGHLPPFVVPPDGPPLPLEGGGPPLGSGPQRIPEHQVTGLPIATSIILYTDGLVERRDRDLDTGIGELSRFLASYRGPSDRLAGELVRRLLPAGPDDDIAILIASVPPGTPVGVSAARRVESEGRAVARARQFVGRTLAEWEIDRLLIEEVVLCASELVTNAILHGRPPIDLRLRLASPRLFLEVLDSGRLLPQRLRAEPDDESGRGLHIVGLLAESWGTRPTSRGKAVWCAFSTAPRPLPALSMS
jgi:PAS domain S-box-containing protein